jgi:uncharacterized protein YgiM (DUF1202 family)
MGAAVFILAATLVIPLIPGQMSGAAAASAPNPAQRGGQTARVFWTATPSATPLPTGTPTPLPTFTPTAPDAPIVQPTQIAYAYAPPTGTPSGLQSATGVAQCTVTAQVNLNLHGDPSTSKPAIGDPIPSGTILTVTGKSKDGNWWKVTFGDGAKARTGWVSGQYATPSGSLCSAVPVS